MSTTVWYTKAKIDELLAALPTANSTIAYDTDNVPYFTIVSSGAIQLDTDGVPYLTA